MKQYSQDRDFWDGFFRAFRMDYPKLTRGEYNDIQLLGFGHQSDEIKTSEDPYTGNAFVWARMAFVRELWMQEVGSDLDMRYDLMCP